MVQFVKIITFVQLSLNLKLNTVNQGKKRHVSKNNKIQSSYSLYEDSDLNATNGNNLKNRVISQEQFILNSYSEKYCICHYIFYAPLNITFPVVNNAHKNCIVFRMYTGMIQESMKLCLPSHKHEINYQYLMIMNQI